jgi:rod shape-determining protein MreC
MESFFVRYRNLLVLLVVLVAQLVGLAVQVRRTGSGRNTLDSADGPGVRLVRLWADALVTPPEQLFHNSKLGTANLWQNYLNLRHVREQNQDLEKTIDRLRLEQAQLLEDAKQGQRLQALVGFQEKYIYKTLVAQAIGSSGNDQSRVFYIDKGSTDGLDRDMAVISPDGIVGKVREVFPHTAQVLAIFAASCAAMPPASRRLWAFWPTSASSREKKCSPPGATRSSRAAWPWGWWKRLCATRIAIPLSTSSSSPPRNWTVWTRSW